MSASKTSLLAVLAFAVLAIPLAYAEDYVILTPNNTSSYYNQNFSYVATYINATLYPNATIVNFSAISDANLNATIAAKSPKFVYLVIQPANLSPDFLNSVDNLLKQLDSDPYLDVGWSVITGYDNTSAKNLFDNNMDSTWVSNYVFVPNGAGAQVAAGSQIASAFSASSYVGPSATNSTINSKLTTSGTDFVYFSGNSSAYNRLISGDNQFCPASDTLGVGGCTASMAVKNLLFFADATEVGRISGTNPDTTWLLQNSTASYLDSLPVAFSRITANAPSNASAYIGPHSTRWVTSENIVKLFASSLGQGKDIISALRFAKNALLFNNRSESLPTNFTLFVESEYNLFGKMQKPSSAPATAKTYSWSFSTTPTHTQNPVIYSANTTNITWNATVAVSTSGTVAALYDSSGWKQSGATAWYRFVSPVSGNKINMSVVAALAGEIRPDNSTLNITSYSGDVLLRNITSFNISVNQTDTDFLANETLQNISSRRYDIDLDRVYFARLFSPNESLADSFQINLTYITSGIQTNRTAISNITKNANLIESFNLINPADRGITNATLMYNLPYNVTSSCSVSQANCTIVDYGGVRYANVTLASVPQGISPLAMYYNTTLGVNTTTDYGIYNLGELLNVTSNAISQNASLLDYNAVLVNSTSGNIVWSNSTKNISVSGTINSTAYTYNISQNITSGTYLLKTYYLSNGTGLYASYEERQITITNSLNLTNATFASNVQDKLNQNYFRVNDSMTATGNVYNIHNAVIPSPYASVNVSLIGNSGTENSTSTTTGALGYYSAPFSWTGSSVGPKTLQVNASYNNNTGAQNVTLFITTYIGNNISVTFDKQAKRIYNLWETPVVTVNVKDPTGTLSVYKAQVNLSSGGTLLNSSETDTNGNAAITFAPSQQNSYSLSASAMSPLNTSKVAVNNTETMYVMWIKTGSNGHFVTSQSPTSAIVGSPVTFYGNLTMSSGNDSLITRPSDALAYQIKTGGSDVTNISGCSLSWESTNSTKFSLSCTPPMAGSYQLWMQAKLTYDAVVSIQTNDTYVFSAGTNASSPGTSGSSGGGTSSSLAGKSCTNNANCTSGDYCSNNVCAAITCTDGAIIDHACVPNKKVNITAQSPLVEIEQGNWGLANFTISNNGFVGLSGVTFTLYLPQAISWANWYSFVSPAPETIAAGVERAVSVNISAPENASIDQYSIKAKVTTKEGAMDEKTFALRVSPSARNRGLVKAGISDLNSTIDALGKDVLEVMKGAPDGERKIAERKLDVIRALYIEAQAALSKGNYFEAYTKQKEMSDVISDLRVILADKKARDSQAASRRNMVAGVVIILAAIAGGFYYLWVPAPSGYSPGRGYSYNAGGKEKRGLEEIVEEVKKKVADILSKFKRQDAVAAKKYDYLKPPAKRW